ncbi:MAG: AAA family ATPase, partial [Peptostreptococcaceae bacterium]|nr:AAA family ATPase [Peptostreptococcaceae bacterium]
MQFLEKEKLNFEEYIKLGSKEDRLEVLKSHWNINEDVLQGKISLFSESDEYFQIRVIRNLDGKYILKNPFEERVLVVKAPKSMFLDDLKNLESDDNVIFRFTPNMHLKDRNNIPIHIIKDSIAKVTNIDLLYSENDFDIVDIIELIKNNEDMKISKVLVNEESFKKNAKEIYTNLYEEAESRKFELQLKNNELENQILENTTELNRIVEVIAKGIIEKQRLINLGILKNHNVSIGKEEKIDIKRSQYVDYIVKFLGSSYEPSLYYNEITIQKLYTALSTSQLVILSGSPGTGKTSLIEGFSDAIGANKKIISVQPNWTETQDLIGFYNPIDKKYISTPFLDFLVDAKNDEDRLYIVCLDEMNLAHVEYYFAEFLS